MFIVIQVADLGPGVPQEALTRLFEPFYRLEVARGRNTSGSGLGLAITKRCMKLAAAPSSPKIAKALG